MPRSEKLPKFADWTPPWGEDAEDIDPDRLAKYIHGLLSDKEKLTGRVEAADEKVTEVTAERDEAVKALAEADAKGADEKLAAATKRAEKAEADLKEAQALSLRYGVALDEGLTKVQAKRLLGNTEEELKADAEELVESFGGSGKASDEEDEEDEEGKVPTRTPNRLTNPVDNNRSDVQELTDADIEAAVGAFGRGSYI